MAEQVFNLAQDAEKAAETAPKGVLLDLSAMNWGPNLKFMRLPIGPNGADRFLALNTTPRSDDDERRGE